MKEPKVTEAINKERIKAASKETEKETNKETKKK